MAKKLSLAPELYMSAESDRDKKWMEIMREQDQRPVQTNNSLPTFTIVVGPSPFTMPRGWEFFLCSPYEGVTYIATVLHNAGYPVKIIDVRYSARPMDEALEKIEEGCDILGMATFEDNYPFIKSLVAKVKDRQPDLPIIAGGSLVTSVPHIFMNDTKIDLAVISEGELTILELMDSYAKHGSFKEQYLGKINGILFRADNGRVMRTIPRGQMKNLDSLPKMRLDLWPQANHPLGIQPQIIASYSRGCKMDCNFCYRTTPQVAMKSQKKLNEDLAWLKSQYNTEFIFFSDLTFNAVKSNTLEVLDVIKDHELRWTCLTRCANVDKEQLDAMKLSGCDIALYGVESLGEGALKGSKKPTTTNISMKAMDMTLAADIRFGGLTIVGLPGETEESLNKMCEWAEETNQITRVKYLSLMPGTHFYYDAIRNGTLKGELDHLNWLSIEQALEKDEFINVSGLPEDIIRSGYKRIYDSYQPGPVMDFKHYPEHFLYFDANKNDGIQSSIDYAGNSWRSEYASAGPHLVEGSEDFILENTGTPETTKVGSILVDCGAKELKEAKEINKKQNEKVQASEKQMAF